MQQEGALHANTVCGNSTQREVLVDPTAAAPDDDPLELLHTLTGALDDPHADTYCVADAKLGNIVLKLALLDLANELLRHGELLLYTKNGGAPVWRSPLAHSHIQTGPDYSIAPGRRQIPGLGPGLRTEG